MTNRQLFYYTYYYLASAHYSTYSYYCIVVNMKTYLHAYCYVNMLYVTHGAYCSVATIMSSFFVTTGRSVYCEAVCLIKKMSLNHPCPMLPLRNANTACRTQDPPYVMSSFV